MKNFAIGKELNRILTEANVIGVKNKIFPLIANANTTFPFLVYRRNYYRPASNKDFEDEIVGIEIVIAATKYEESVDIADAVASALLHKETSIIDDIQISNMYEDFVDDTFLQHINIDIYIK
jgi:hypothetical protein